MLQTHFQRILYSINRSIMSSSALTSAVKHDTIGKEFYIQFQSSEKGYLSYEEIGEKTLDLQHTFVPESLRGKGIAKLLAESAFEYVADHNLKMRLTCWYLQKYAKDNPLEKYTSRIIE